MAEGKDTHPVSHVLRDPPEETVDIYPGLCVDDARVSGSTRVGRSRLPLWAFIGIMVNQGWETAASEDYWPELDGHGWSQEQMARFLYRLTQPRGEFARLLLLLAEVERGEEAGPLRSHEALEQRQRVRQQLQRCLDALAEADEAPSSP